MLTLFTMSLFFPPSGLAFSPFLNPCQLQDAVSSERRFTLLLGECGVDLIL